MAEHDDSMIARYARVVASVRREQRKLFDRRLSREEKSALTNAEGGLDYATGWVARHTAGLSRELAVLADHVGLMRRIQGRFIKGDRSPSTIAASKRAEKKVDELVARVLDPQARLFADGEDGEAPGGLVAGPGPRHGPRGLLGTEIAPAGGLEALAGSGVPPRETKGVGR